MFAIEDERHAELHGEYPTIESAIDELKKRTTIPWDQTPNVAPCTNWKNCGRGYEIIEYDDSVTPWNEIRRIPMLTIEAKGVHWDTDPTTVH